MSYTDFDFPHTSLYTSDLREIIANMRRLEDIVKTFVNTEQVKFADPIIWNITSQYAKTTVVLDTSGNAYLSKQAVPSGIQLNNEEYWQEIFNFTEYTRTANQNLTVNEERNTTRATDSYAVDDWLIWNDVLYKVTSAIAVDDTLIIGTNIVHFTVEDFIKAWIVSSTALINQYKNDIDASELSFTTNLQSQFNQAISGVTVDSEVLLARIGYSGYTYTTLEDRLNAEIGALRNYDNMQYFKIMGILTGGAPSHAKNRITMPFLQFTGKCSMIGIDSLDYDFRIIYYSKPKLDSAYYVGQGSWCIPTYTPRLFPFNSEYEGNYFTLLIRRKDDADITESELEALPTKIIYFGKKDRFYPEFKAGDTIDLNSIDIVSKFCAVGGATQTNTVLNAPEDFSGTFTVFNLPRIFRLFDAQGFAAQILMSNTNRFWIRYVRYQATNISVYADWTVLKLTGIYALEDKTVAIIGDSASTMYNNNAVELTITEDDIGVSLSAYITRYDVAAGLTIDGYTFTEADIGTEKTFIPRTEDVGKVVGLPNNYNPSGIKPWWYQMKQYSAFNAINVSWSGSSYSSHDENENNYKTSYAWHPAQIRKCGIRTAGSMNRTAPDYIILARGGNDWSHSPYDKLTEGYFNNYNWSYPVDDKVGNNYGFKEAISKTVQALRAAYPSAKILICTWPMIHRINYGHFPPNNGTNSAVQFNDAIREAAKFFGLGLIDLDKSGITFENFSSYSRDTPPVHPNNAGHLLLCEKAAAEINAQY